MTRQSAESITSGKLWRAFWGWSNRGRKKNGAERPRKIQCQQRHEFASTHKNSKSYAVLVPR